MTELDQVLQEGLNIYVLVNGEPFYGSMFLSGSEYQIILLVNDDEQEVYVPQSNVRITDIVDEDGNTLIGVVDCKELLPGELADWHENGKEETSDRDRNVSRLLRHVWRRYLRRGQDPEDRHVWCPCRVPRGLLAPVKNMKLREIPFGTTVSDPDFGYCIYTNGHVAKDLFLEAVKAMIGSEVPIEARAALEVGDVEHTRFRPMSPTEARANGIDWGVMETDRGGYPVTAVKF